MFYVDNNSTRDVAISASARTCVPSSLLEQLVHAEERLSFYPWYSRVPSPSNPADSPMREVVKPNVIQRFHALGGVKEDRPGATTFVLTVSLDAEARPNINKALQALTETAAATLIGARIRPERSHKPLPEDLQRAIDATRRQ